MPGKLINTTLSSLASGVSEQYEAGRFDSQVSEMVNCMPSLTRGVLRRNPVQAVSDISTGDLTGAYTYTYDRGTDDEQYLIVVPGDKSMSVYNLNNGTLLYNVTNKDYLEAPVGTVARDNFSAITIGDHTFVLNKSIVTNFTSDLSSSSGYSDMAFYWIKKTTSVVTDQYQTGAGTSGAPIESGSKTKGYDYTLNNFQVNAGAETRPTYTRLDLNKSTVIAEAFVEPDQGVIPIVPTMTSNTAPSGIASASTSATSYEPYFAFSDASSGLYWAVSQWAATTKDAWLQYQATTGSIVTQYTISPTTGVSWVVGSSYTFGPKTWTIQGSNDGSTWNDLQDIEDYTDWRAGETRTFRFTNSTSYTYHRIHITAMSNGGNAAISKIQFIEEDTGYVTASQATHITYDSTGAPNSSICYCITEPSKWDWEDSFGNQASRGVWQTVPDSEELPATLPEDLDGFKVKVNGKTTSIFDDYFLDYSHESKSWKETLASNINYRIDGSTMPHTLYRLADGSFLFDEFKIITDDGLELGDSAWNDRIIGGSDLSTEDPSFLGRPLNNILFFKNRLGLLTDDNIVLSRTGSYGNFFLKTLQDQLDDDPIDLAIASTDVSILRHAVALSGKLIIFSDDTQFTLESSEGSLTAKSATIEALSNYTYNGGAPARAIGNKVYFTNNTSNYSQVYTYTITDSGSKIAEAVPRTIHLPTYIPNDVYSIIGHDVLGMTFFSNDTNPKELIVLTSVSKGSEDLQNAFHKWEFQKNILSTHIINNKIYLLFIDGLLVAVDLDIPGSIDDINYQDTYGDVTTDEYTSYIKFSQFYYRGADGKGTERGRYQLRTMKHNITASSHYRTIITNTNLVELLDADIHFGPTWIDTDVWDDSLVWVDVQPNYSRVYDNDEKVTIMGNSQLIDIRLSSSIDEPYKGFELATTNIEAFFHQRSTRV